MSLVINYSVDNSVEYEIERDRLLEAYPDDLIIDDSNQQLVLFSTPTVEDED